MKIFSFVLTLFILSLVSNLYGETVTIRPGSSVGYCSADDMKGLSYTYGLKILLMANEFQRYGIKIDHFNILADEKHSYLSTGLFIEQVVFNYFNMGIGTVGYINTMQWGENPFGLYTHLGFEYNFKKWFGIVTAYQFVDKPTEVYFGNFLLGTINQDTGLIEPSCTIMQATKNA